MRKYLWTLLFAFALTSTGLVLVLIKISLEDFPILAQSLFYTFFFLSLFSLLTLLGYFLRRLASREINKFASFALSCRQGVLLAIFASVSAYLLHISLFYWWLELLLLGGLLLVEIFFTVIENKGIKEEKNT